MGRGEHSKIFWPHLAPLKVTPVGRSFSTFKKNLFLRTSRPFQTLASESPWPLVPKSEMAQNQQTLAKSSKSPAPLGPHILETLPCLCEGHHRHRWSCPCGPVPPPRITGKGEDACDLAAALGHGNEAERREAVQKFNSFLVFFPSPRNEAKIWGQPGCQE